MLYLCHFTMCPDVLFEHVFIYFFIFIFIFFFNFGKLFCHCGYRALSMLTQLGHLISVLEFNYKPVCLGIM